MVYLLVEKGFGEYPWCKRILRGLYEEARKKRISIQELSVPEDAANSGSCVLLVCGSGEWNNHMIRRCRAAGLHPVSLANQSNAVTGQPVSRVTMDIHGSMALAIRYLYSLGRRKLALYGVNPSASSDPWRAKRFEELTRSSGNTYYLDPTVEACFHKFYPRIADYDGVICASDYAAVSLIQRLREKGYPIPEKLYIVSYGNMYLAQICNPSITSISDDYENFGRAALAICSMVERNDTVVSAKVNIKSRLHIRQTTENRPFNSETAHCEEEELPQNLFFADPEISALARVEMMFNQFDETDFSLLRLLLEGASYQEMSQKCFISETAAKYRLKKMKDMCGVHTRKELVSYLNRFL